MHSKTVVWITFFLLLVSSNSFSADRTFRGKIIDAETLKPIEGAVVVAVWKEARGGIAGPDTRFKDAKETLTDKNGEWSITGPEGDEDKLIGILQIIGVFITRDPVFIIYKPGYREYYNPGGFQSYSCVINEQNVEGIVLMRSGISKEERKEHYKKYKGFLPFIPLKDPERRLRNLDFSFQYPEEVKKIGTRIRKKGIRSYWVYTVIGLPKAKTREERLRAQPSPPTDYIEELPILYKMINEESKGFGLKPIGRRKPK